MSLFFFNIYFIDFLQKGRERDRELETSMREKHRPAASCTPPTRDVPATNILHALDRNRTWDLLVRRLTNALPLSQTGFGSLLFIIIIILLISERKGERQIETSTMRENYQLAASCTPHPEDGARNPGRCPDRESNRDLLVHRPTLNN
uniref:Uncharacterized protein n=1 Tax=Pipistrellus kuhlii TaxID=59472 RepID=A0A7J7VMB5_PIPKU|nr:hypothetical protein mPipKuh1_008378 [Pipistrellus kuhlii]